MIQCVVFDLDGTLINTLEDLTDAANDVLKEYGYPTHDVDAIQAMVGHGGFELMKLALPQGKNSDLETRNAFEKFKSCYEKRMTNKTKPYEGIRELLTELKNRDIPIAVHTNKPQFAATEIVQYLFSEFSFVDVIGYRSEETRKPNPHFTLKIAKKAGVKPGDCLFVGDSLADYETGKNAGMKIVLVTWGFRDRQHLSQKKDAILIDHPMELIACLS
jgi:phosphoglycolate phosphatase